MKHLAAALFLVAALPAQAQDLGPVSPDWLGKDTSPRTLAAEHAQVAWDGGAA